MGGFIDCSILKSHGHGIGFVGGGVVELTVNHDRDRNEVRLAIGRELQQTDGAWPFAHLTFFRILGKRQWQHEQATDDAQHGFAV